MKRAPHTELRHKHQGADVYVLGAGRSMKFVDPAFFEGKVTVGVNSIWKFFPAKYCVFKHDQLIQEAIEARKTVVVMSKHDCGDVDKRLNIYKADYVFTHKRGRFEDREGHLQENLDAIGRDDDIFVSHSTITSGIHLAAFMGARNILVCGHDCGYIDGETHLDNYAQHLKDFHQTDENFRRYYNEWFRLIAEDTVRLKAKLIEVYGCGVYGFNPFVNLRLEGHRFAIEKL